MVLNSGFVRSFPAAPLNLMAHINCECGRVGIDAITPGTVSRLWIDKGRGKYISLDLTPGEVRQLVQMVGGFSGGAHLKPPRGLQAEDHK